MKKLLLDTNIYGLMVADSERKDIHEQLHQGSLLIFGFDVVRKELRDTPKNISFQGKDLRIDLLSVYDDLVKKSYSINDQIIGLAENYFLAYRELGGSIAKTKILNDFLIVACATLKQMDIVVSDDAHSLLTENALRAYRLTNEIRKIKTPNFLTYLKFKEMIKT